MYKAIFRPIFFLFKPEFIHKLVFIALKIGTYIPFLMKIFKFITHYNKKELEVEFCGLKFKNPVGIAAGLDKDAEVFDFLYCLGFSHIEIGTITPKAQPGNPKPRLFRFIKDEALINRMGFNNSGVNKVYKNLNKKRTDVLIAGNIGKNKITPNDEAINDYIDCFEGIFEKVDYFVVNVSSPNTPNLRDLQEKEPLKKLLSKLQKQNDLKNTPKPILLKIAPDLSFEQIDDIIEIVKITKIAGIVATNTTITRNNLTETEDKINSAGEGGLSGQPLKEKSTQIIKYIHDKTNGTIPIIGVGGIANAQDAIEKLEAGATLVQIFTSFIYEGPFIAKKINKGILKHYQSKN